MSKDEQERYKPMTDDEIRELLQKGSQDRDKVERATRYRSTQHRRVRYV